MFNLGYKQIVINSDAVVSQLIGTTTGPGGQVVVEGFGTFYTSPVILDGNEKAPQAPVAGVYRYFLSTPTFDALVDGCVITATIRVHSSRKLSEIYPYNYDTMVYQSAPVSIAAPGAATEQEIADAFAAGQVTVWSDDNDILTWEPVLGAGGDKMISFAPEYAGYDLLLEGGTSSVTVGNITVLEGERFWFDNDGVVGAGPAADGTVAPTEGWGTGKQIEAEVRNATFDNIDPYGIQFGGNTAVDVRGMYHTLYLKTDRDSERIQTPGLTPTDPPTGWPLLGWENHEMANSGGGVNTDNAGEPREYIFYVNTNTTTAWGMINSLLMPTADIV